MIDDVEVVLMEKDKNTPYITKKDNKYYIKHYEYTDDINLLLNAIKNVKEINYNDYYKIQHECKNFEEFFQINLNFNWSTNSNSLFVYSITKLWNEELTRRGHLKCSKCNM